MTRGQRVFWWVSLLLCIATVVVVLLPGAVVLTAWWTSGTEVHVSEDLLNTVVGFGLAAAFPLLCLMWIAHLMRRGGIRRSAERRGRVLSAGTFEASGPMLSLRGHVWWVIGLSLGCVALWGLPLTVPRSVSAEPCAPWYIVGGVGIVVLGVVVGSLIKKVAWLRRARRAGGRIPGPGRGRAFWRWFSYRWRLDLWWSGVATVPVLLTLFVVGDSVVDGEPVTGFWWGALAVTVLSQLAAWWSCTQFWRSGANLARMESVA